MNVTPEVLAELRRRHLNATAAPWVVEEHMDGILTVETSNEAIWKRLDILQISVRGKVRLRGENNGKFIALVRNNIGALLDELEAVRAERDRLRKASAATAAKARRLLRMDGLAGVGDLPISADMAILNFINGLLPETGWTTQRLWEPSPNGGHRMLDGCHDLVDVLRSAIGDAP